MLSIGEINLLVAQNEGLKKQNEELQQACKSLEQECEKYKQAEEKLVNQIKTICDFINNRSEIFKGIYGSVDKIITDYAEQKEQECERYKKFLDLAEKSKLDVMEENIKVGNERDKYKQECEELKETISDFISDNRSMYCYDDRQPVTLEEMQECMEFTYKVGLKYKQAVEEIEKICLKVCSICWIKNKCNKEYSNCKGAEILTIINKAKDGNNE